MCSKIAKNARDILIHELHRDYNIGRLMELKLYESIERSLSHIRILHESQLRQLYGWDSSGIDFLIEYENGIVPIQCKYRKTRRREDYGIRNFLKSIVFIQEHHPKPILFGLWVSRITPFDDNRAILCNNNIYSVSNFSSMEVLADCVINTITKLLQKQ